MVNINTMPLEAETRVLIDRTLENLGWKLKGKDKNVFYEQPRSEAERKKLGGKRPDYVLYSKESDRPLIVIEAKKKGSRIDIALEQGISYARAIEAPLVFATDGVFCKAFHTVANRPPILNGQEIDEFIREALALRYLTSYEVNTVSPKVQYDRKELIRIFDEANNMLRGDGLRAGIERFGEFANILFLKLVSENEQIKRESGIASKFDIASCSWDSIKNIAPSARIEYINNTVYKRLNDLYQTEIFTPLTIRDETILKEIMDKLDPLMLTDVDSDVKGDAFEYFLKASTSTKNDLGEYFTPRHIVKTMVRLVNPQIGEKVYDPFCGTGGFLIESFRYIYNNMARTEVNLKTLRESTVYGNEITNTARITKMNMILAGDGHSNIQMLDSLANPIDGTAFYTDNEGKVHHKGFDIVLANMPYSQKTKHGSLYDLPSTNGDSICVQHCMKAINSTAENGRMALVVPEGFLFRKDLAKTREYLLDHCQLQSIISLPQGVFLPYTGVKTDIIYATKVNQKVKSSEKKKDYWYFEVKSDGYTLDNRRRKLETPSDLSKYEEYRKLDEDQSDDMMKVGFETIPLDKVRKNSYILVGSRYREQKQINSRYDVVPIGEVATLHSGYAFPMHLQGQNGTIPFYKVSDMNSAGNEIEMGKSNNYVSTDLVNSKRWSVAPAGTIIFPKIGAAIATNKKRVLSVPAIFDNNVMGIVCGKKILPRFMLYMLEHIDISQWASLANPPSISQKVVLEQEIPLPSLDIQQKIVSELDGYRQVVNGANCIVDNYKTNFSIKSDWEILSLGDICEFEYGYTETSTDVGDVRYIRITDINADGTISNSEQKYIKLNEENRKYLLKYNDVLVARIGATYGKTMIFDERQDAIFASYLIRLKFNTKILPKYYFYYAQSVHYWEQARTLVTGAGQPQFNANIMKLIKVPVPSIEEQQRIIKQCDAERLLVKPAKDIAYAFTKKIEAKVNEVWGE